MLGAPEACKRLLPGVERPENLAGYREGRKLEEAVREAYRIAYAEVVGG